jgi:hypothetical protein
MSGEEWEVERSFVELAFGFNSIQGRASYLQERPELLRDTSLAQIHASTERGESVWRRTTRRLYHNFLLCARRTSIDQAIFEFDLPSEEVFNAVMAINNTQSVTAAVLANMNVPELGSPEVVRVFRFLQAQHAWDSEAMRILRIHWDTLASYRPEALEGRLFDLTGEQAGSRWVRAPRTPRPLPADEEADPT